MARIQGVADAPTDLDRVWGLRPRYYERYVHQYLTAAQQIDPIVFELCRLRMAQIHGNEFEPSLRYQPAADAGLTEDKIAALSRYPTSELFSERERACLNFAEQFVMQWSGITDEDAARLQEVISPTEFVMLTRAIGMTDQFQRACTALDVQPSATVPALLEGFVVAPSTRPPATPATASSN
jgi:alkylhydroperoxidase family enzyme